MKSKSLRNRITILTAATGALCLFPLLMNAATTTDATTMERPMIRPFNPATMQTIKGAVVEVQKIGVEGRAHFGVHLLVKTEKETLEVHLGPSFYLEANHFKISKNDVVEVTGSLVNDGNQRFMIASEIKIGDKGLKLRDAQGLPLWRGGAAR